MYMNPVRKALLAASGSTWLQTRATTLPSVRRGVLRFMPGETLEEAVDALDVLARQGIAGVLTELGEGIDDPRKADEAARHYEAAVSLIGLRALDCDVSVKLTHLGCDIDLERCIARVRALAAHAAGHRRFVWIDMEQHAYVDRTLRVYRQLVPDFQNVGVCLQAYLHRTADDLAALLELGGGVRLVKGAYREPPSIAHPQKRDVDEKFLLYAARLLAARTGAAALRVVFGTHDRRMIDGIRGFASGASVPATAFEFHLLYGIQRATQMQLVREGYRVRVLISYGTQWFPWYMRRLAERPANLAFAVKALFSD